METFGILVNNISNANTNPPAVPLTTSSPPLIDKTGETGKAGRRRRRRRRRRRSVDLVGIN